MESAPAGAPGALPVEDAARAAAAEFTMPSQRLWRSQALHSELLHEFAMQNYLELVDDLDQAASHTHDKSPKG